MGALTKAIEMIFPKQPSRRWSFGRLGDERSYDTLVGDGSGSNIVDSCLSFIINGFTQMYPVVAQSIPDDIDAKQILAAHPAAVLFRRPVYDPDLRYSWYSWHSMIAGALLSYCVDGNGYLMKVRGAGGVGLPVQLWYTPHFMLEPRWDPNDPSKFITCYDYSPWGTWLTEGAQSVGRPEGPVFRIDPRNVIHLRDGLDPQNTRKGFSKLKKLLREIFTDEQAARFTASILMNHGMPGVIISPDQGIALQDDAEEVKERFRSAFSGDRVGSTLVMRGPTKIQEFGFSPEKMMLRELRSIPEERISASLGVSAAVVGLGAGLMNTKVGKTLEEYVDLSWQNGILSRSRPIAGLLTEQLVAEWNPEEASVSLDFLFDTSHVPIMATYNKSEADRHSLLFSSGLEDRGEGRRSLGIKPSPRDDVFMVPSGSVEVPSNKTIQQAPAVAVAKNGNGKDGPKVQETEKVVA